MKIGFIGLGRMGSPIAGRLLQAGHELRVFNRTAAKAAELVRAGARAASTPAEACAEAEVVFTMLADDDALCAIVLDGGGLVEHLGSGAVHVAMGTHGVPAIREIAAAHAQRGQSLVAAPVLGRPEAVVAGQLGIVAAGAPAALDRCRPLFAAIGRRTFDAGDDPGGASALKLANNFVLGCAIEALAEAFSLVRSHGVQADVLHDVLTEGLFACPAYRTYARLIADEAWGNPGFTARLALKDIRLVLEAGEAAAVPLPAVSQLRDRLLGAIAHGDAECDWSVLAHEQARAAGLAQ